MFVFLVFWYTRMLTFAFQVLSTTCHPFEHAQVPRPPLLQDLSTALATSLHFRPCHRTISSPGTTLPAVRLAQSTLGHRPKNTYRTSLAFSRCTQYFRPAAFNSRLVQQSALLAERRYYPHSDQQLLPNAASEHPDTLLRPMSRRHRFNPINLPSAHANSIRIGCIPPFPAPEGSDASCPNHHFVPLFFASGLHPA